MLLILLVLYCFFPTVALSRDDTYRPFAYAQKCLSSGSAALGVEIDIQNCYRSDLDMADAELNRVYRSVLINLKNARERTRLRISERKWLADRDKRCWPNQGGDEGQLGVDKSLRCLITETDRRTVWLKNNFRAR